MLKVRAVLVNSKKKLLLHLSLIDGLGPIALGQLLQVIPDTFQFDELYLMRSMDLVERFGIPGAMASKIVDGLADRALLDHEQALLDDYNLDFITIACHAYPHLLKNIHMPPTVLYYRGARLDTYDKHFAIVGARKANHYGQSAIESFVPELVLAGFSIVSGGAVGADSMAHRAALNAGGRTIAVIGSGLLRPYPACNRRLFDQIVQSGGTIVSPFKLELAAHTGTFPARNRIISGLSVACLVAQAAKKSGARITAEYALEQGREVFAIPGPIGDPLSFGCHALLADGAAIAYDIGSIFKALGMRQPSNQLQKSGCRASAALSESAQRLLNSCDVPCAINELLEQTGMSLDQLNQELFSLQLQGLLEQTFNGMWRRV